MRQQLPPLNWLRTFEAAARLLSFTAAGEELGLTQAAVSQHIKALEQTLGRPLFIRLTRSLKLTEAGEAYFAMLQPLLTRIADGTESLFGSRATNRLVIRVNAAFSVLWLAPRLPAFLAAHPELKVRIVNPVWSVTDFEEGADFDIVYGDGAWPGRIVDRLTDDTLFPVCRPGAIDDGDPGAFAGQRLIHVMGYRDGWADWLSAAGLSGVGQRRILQCDNSIMAFEVAAEGAGVALARRSLAKGHLEAGRLIRPFDIDIPVSEEFYLVAAPGRLTAGANAFRQWILSVNSGLGNDSGNAG